MTGGETLRDAGNLAGAGVILGLLAWALWASGIPLAMLPPGSTSLFLLGWAGRIAAGRAVERARDRAIWKGNLSAWERAGGQP